MPRETEGQDEPFVTDTTKPAPGDEAGEPRSFGAANDQGEKPDPGEDADDEKDPHVDRQLDKGLKETFPASDPVSINPGAD